MNTIVPAGTWSGDAVYNNVVMPEATQATHNPNPRSLQHENSPHPGLDGPPGYKYISNVMPGPVQAYQIATADASEFMIRWCRFADCDIDKMVQPPVSFLRAIGAEKQRLELAGQAKTAAEQGILEFPPGADVSHQGQSEETFGLTEIPHAYIQTIEGKFVDVFEIDEWYVDYHSGSVPIYKPRLPTEKSPFHIEAVDISDDDETVEDPTGEDSPHRGTAFVEKKRRRSSPVRLRKRMKSNDLSVGDLDAYLKTTKQYREYLRRPIEGIVKEEGEFVSIDERGLRKRVYYHHLIRKELLRLANPRNKKYRGEPAGGLDQYDQTAYLSSQKHWGGDLEHIPDIALQFDPPPKDITPTKPSQLLYKGCLVLDLEDRAMVSWPCLPLTISSALEGWRWLAWQRMERQVLSGDILARMPKEGRFKAATYHNRSSRFRGEHWLYAWYQRGPAGSLSRAPLWKRLPQSARDNNSTRGVLPMNKDMRDEVDKEVALARRFAWGKAAETSSTGQGDEDEPIEILDSEEEGEDNPLPILDL